MLVYSYAIKSLFVDHASAHGADALLLAILQLGGAVESSGNPFRAIVSDLQTRINANALAIVAPRLNSAAEQFDRGQR